MLRAYVDASTRDDSGLLSVAAYLFESGRVRRFRQQWRDAFGHANFSWADLVARSGPFKGLRGRQFDKEHTGLVKAGVSIVRDHVIAESVVSLWKQDVVQFSPTWITGFGHAYSVAGHMALAGMGRWAQRNHYKGGIAYVLEAGDEGQDQLEHLLSYASKSPEAQELYQWAGHSTVPKTPCSAFHAPDLLAWEWGKWWAESVFDRRRPMRLSLVGLLVDRLDDHYFQFLAGEPLLRFFSQIHALGVEQLQEDRAALTSVQPVDVSDAVKASAQIELAEDRG